jgi:hypothetical protein
MAGLQESLQPLGHGVMAKSGFRMTRVEPSQDPAAFRRSESAAENVVESVEVAVPFIAVEQFGETPLKSLEVSEACSVKEQHGRIEGGVGHARILPGAPLRELLMANGVALSPSHADAEETYEGRGADAVRAWEAFRVVAGEPAFDPVDLWDEGTIETVTHAGFLFEAAFTEGWPARHGNSAMPEHYELMFTRQFATEDAGDMVGFHFTIFVAPLAM